MLTKNVLYEGKRISNTRRMSTIVFFIEEDGSKTRLDPYSDVFPRDCDFDKNLPHVMISDMVVRPGSGGVIYLEWGDLCRGSLRLAITILNDYFSNLDNGTEIPYSAYLHFMRSVVREFPFSGWTLSRDDMEKWKHSYAELYLS